MAARTNATTEGILTGSFSIDVGAAPVPAGTTAPGFAYCQAQIVSPGAYALVKWLGNCPAQTPDYIMEQTALADPTTQVTNYDEAYEALSNMGTSICAVYGVFSCDPNTFPLASKCTLYLLYASETGDYEYAWDNTTISVSFSLGFKGVSLWRSSTITTGIYRQHMDKDDVSFRDQWKIDRNTVFSSTVNGMSTEVRFSLGGPGEEVTIDTALEENFQISYDGISFIAGDNFCTVTLNGVDFDGLDTRASVNGNPDARTRILGSGNSVTLDILDSIDAPAFIGATETWSVPTRYSYVPERAFFQEDNSTDFDPQIIDGFTGGVSYKMSELPSGISDSNYSWKARVKLTNTFSPSIEPIWALQNEWYEEYDQEDDNFDVNRMQNDLSCGVRVYGATNETYYNVVGFTRTLSKSIIPAVERKDPLHPETWVGDGLEVSGTNSEVWTIPVGGVGTSSLALQSRYMERLEILPYIDWTGATSKAKNWDWPKTFNPKAKNVGDDAEISNNILYAEDVWCWKSYSFLKIKLHKSTDFDMTFDLVLNYRIVEVDDPHYTCGSYRADEYQIYSNVYTATYPCRLRTGQDTFVVDLLCPIEKSVPYLMLVETVSFQDISNTTGNELVITLEELALVQDQGYDHTGRGYTEAGTLSTVAPTTYVNEHWYECCDYFSDFSGWNVTVDGNLGTSLVIPDEPIRQRTEQNIANIQRLRHCPTYDGPAVMLDFMRPIESTQYANDPGLAFSINQSEEARMNRDDIRRSTNTIKGLTMLDIKHETNKEISASGVVRCGFLGGTWIVMPGFHYNITVPKTMGGAYWTLLKDQVNNRRYIKSLIPATWQYVVYQQSEYKDEDGNTISNPSNKPEPNSYELVIAGDLDEKVDALGIFRGPNLKPSRTRMYNADKALDLDVQTDYQEKTYTIYFWADDSWSDYDLNVEEDKAAFDASPNKLGEKSFKIYNRRWVDDSFEIIEPKRISAIIHPSQQIVVAKAPGLKWKGEVGAATGRTRLDIYRREDGQKPYKTTGVKRLANPQVLTLATGNSLLIGDTSQKGVTAIEYSFDGRMVEDNEFPVLDNRICPSACVGSEQLYHVMVYNLENKKMQYYQLYRNPDEDWKWLWKYISDIATGSPIPGSIMQSNDGTLYAVFLNKMHYSNDGGHTWADSGLTLPGTCITAAIHPTTNEIYFLSRVKNWDDKQFYMQLARIINDDGTLMVDDDGKSKISVADRMPGQLLFTNDGEILALIAKDNNITVYVSTDGHTWDEV